MKCNNTFIFFYHNTFIYGSKTGKEKDVVRLHRESAISIMKCLIYNFELFKRIYRALEYVISIMKPKLIIKCLM
jgi:hypothetical protein